MYFIKKSWRAYLCKTETEAADLQENKNGDISKQQMFKIKKMYSKQEAFKKKKESGKKKNHSK